MHTNKLTRTLVCMHDRNSILVHADNTKPDHHTSHVHTHASYEIQGYIRALDRNVHIWVVKAANLFLSCLST